MNVRRFFLTSAAALVGLTMLSTGAAYAADEASIDHSEVSKGVLRMLVSVPGDEEVDLDSVSVTFDGTAVEASAESAGSSDAVRRTTILAIDTSFSMRGERINSAKRAAQAFLDAVPANVEVGIVTFDVEVRVAQEPSLDRATSKSVIDSLELGADTALYDGVRAAITAGGDGTGQRQILVLSDGRETSNTPLEPVIAQIKRSKVKVDVVSLDPSAKALAPLIAMANAGKGKVISSNPTKLASVFKSEAASIGRQVLVSATVPDDQFTADANVKVTLNAGANEYETAALLAVGAGTETTEPTLEVKATDNATFDIPTEVMYGGIAAIGLGLIVLVTALLAGGPSDRRPTLAQQFEMYGASASTTRLARDQAAAAAGPVGIAQQARQAADAVLGTNKGFEASIANRLEGAGMAIKASEWLLLHLAITFVAGFLGLILSGGNPLGLVLLVLLGAIGPWLYLSVKRSRRLAAFDAQLADTLQLMAGSLSAGLSLAQSMDTIVREGNEPITSEFKRVIAEARLGVTLEDALEGVAERMQSVDFRWVVMAIRIQREVGGNLSELLLKVAATLREREYIRRHVQALSAEGRLSCWILGGLPPIFLLYLTFAKPDYVEPLYTTALGLVMCAAMAILLSVGIFWMSKVAKVEI